VIPTFDNRLELEACLRSLATASRDRSLRALVCVDGSTDGTQAWLKSTEFPFVVEVLEHSDRQNHGRAATRNLALDRLEADVTVLLDSDMQPVAEAIDRHVDLVTRSAGVSVGDVVYLNAHDNIWARYMGTRGKNKFRSGSRMPSLYLTAGNVALPTRAFRGVGGFDETLSAYGAEDTELGLRLGAHGVPVYFNAAAGATTVERKSVEVAMAQLRELGRENLPRIRRRHPNALAPFLINRLESPRLADRLFRALLNPVADLAAKSLLRIGPWPIQRRLLNYLALRSLWRGYAEGVR